MEMNLKKSTKTLGKAVAVSSGVAAGSLGMSFVPESVPGIAKGAIGMALGLGVALISPNPYVQSAALGITASGTLVLLKEATEGQTGFLQQFNSHIPALGEPDEFYLEEQPDRTDRLLSGVGNADTTDLMLM